MFQGHLATAWPILFFICSLQFLETQWQNPKHFCKVNKSKKGGSKQSVKHTEILKQFSYTNTIRHFWLTRKYLEMGIITVWYMNLMIFP